ncbi:hypothetical protein [Mastigocladopsis repens]|uniref:hypothetical protein n=1 Tax=Mastigocladopsis repens TaxID=221287 RepID=UPI000364BF6A|nr:hypothetical protein [Mastigocladopsis repens]
MTIFAYQQKPLRLKLWGFYQERRGNVPDKETRKEIFSFSHMAFLSFKNHVITHCRYGLTGVILAVFAVALFTSLSYLSVMLEPNYSGLQLGEVHKEIMNHRWTSQRLAQRSCKEGFPPGKLRGVPPVVATGVQMDTDKLVLRSDEKRCMSMHLLNHHCLKCIQSFIGD